MEQIKQHRLIAEKRPWGRKVRQSQSNLNDYYVTWINEYYLSSGTHKRTVPVTSIKRLFADILGLWFWQITLLSTPNARHIDRINVCVARASTELLSVSQLIIISYDSQTPTDSFIFWLLLFRMLLIMFLIIVLIAPPVRMPLRAAKRKTHFYANMHKTLVYKLANEVIYRYGYCPLWWRQKNRRWHHACCWHCCLVKVQQNNTNDVFLSRRYVFNHPWYLHKSIKIW